MVNPQHFIHRCVGLVLIGALSGCAHQPVPSNFTPTKGKPGYTQPQKQRAPVSGPRRYVLNQALESLGTPYRYGGSNPRGFDCSGLVYFSFQQAGIAVPRTAQQQRERARTVAIRDLRAGDLLFFTLTGNKTSHVGIYAGNGNFVHAPSSGKQVSLASLDNPYWRRHLSGAGHYF